MNGAVIARAAAVGLFAALPPWGEAGAQAREGAYAGTIQCDGLSGLRALKTAGRHIGFVPTIPSSADAARVNWPPPSAEAVASGG